jgi:hypothetical protein
LKFENQQTKSKIEKAINSRINDMTEILRKEINSLRMNTDVEVAE